MSKSKESPSKSSVSVNDIPLMPWEKKAAETSEGDEKMLAVAESLIGDHTDESEPEAEEAEPAEPEEESEEEAESPEANEPEAEAAEPEDDDPEFEIDGERVKLSELRKERLRQADYTRKTQELAKEREAVKAERETEVAAYREKRDTYAGLLAQVEEALQEPEPNWAKIREEDPDGFAQAFADYKLRQEQRDAVKAERDRIAAEQQKEKDNAFATYVAQQKAKLLELIPEWQDESKARAEVSKIVEYAKTTYGYTDEEISNTYDARAWEVLRKAAKYDESQAKGKEKIAAVKPSKVLKPGARQIGAPVKNAQAKAVQAAIKQARKTGRERDAVAAILGLLPD
jgi:hypothetical protein